MAHDVFISHSSKNKLTADAICHSLEQNGIRCWIAPRDVRAGANYGAEIMRGIKDCKVLILIFSESSNASPAVVKEVETAFSNRKTIIPFRIDKTIVSDELSFYIAGNHWIDAYPNDRIFKELVNNVKRTLGMPVVEPVEEGAQEKKKTGFFKKLFGTKQQEHSTPPTEHQPVAQPAPATRHQPVAQPVPATRHQPVTQPATTPPKPASNPEPVIRKPMPPVNPTDPIKPAGKAEIIFCDRSHYTVPANYLYIRTWDKLYPGFAKGYNGTFQIVKFHDIKRYQIVTPAKSESEEYKSALEFADGTTQSMTLFKTSSNIVFPNANETVVREFKDIACITFDRNAGIDFETQEVGIHLKNGAAYRVPYPLLLFGSRVKPSPNARSWSSSIHWENSLSLHDCPKISTAQLKSIRFNDVKIGSGITNEKIWLDKCEVELELRDGSSKTGNLAMDSLHIWTVKADGPFEILVQDIDRMEFGDLPASSTVSAMPPVDRLPELMITPEEPEKIDITDSDRSVPFETLPQPVYPAISSIPPEASVYAPKGIAVIKTSSGEIHYAIANSIAFYRGNMKESFIETADKEKLSVNDFETAAYIIEKDAGEGEIQITDTDGDKYKSGILKSTYAVHFIELPSLEQKEIRMKQSFTMAFDWNRHANVDLGYVLIEKDSGIPVAVPGIGFGFDYLGGMGSRNTQRTLTFNDGLTIPSQKIRSLDITDKKSTGGYHWAISMDVVKKNGEKISTGTSGNIQVAMLTANGMEYIHLQKLKRIEFGDLPRTAPVLPAAGIPGKIDLTDSDRSVPFETLPQPVYPTISGIPPEASVYVPKGIAVIKTSSGIYYAIANSITFYRGNMKESFIETADREKLSVNDFETAAYTVEKGVGEGEMQITDTDGYAYKSGIKYYAVHFIELPSLEQKKIEIKQSFTTAFDWNRHANVALRYVLIEKDNGAPVAVPGIGFGFDYIGGGMFGRNTQRVPIFKDGLVMPSNKIRSLEITDKKALSGYDWGISMDIVKKNGEKIPAYTSGNIHVFMLTANGIEYIHLQNLKRIVYLD